jgi:glycosyltransferase involved in cell wall biosynthesis
MNNPLVSIIIPCFNAADTIAEAIGSALAQTYRPVEVIVVDDGSTDNSAAVVQEFGSEVHYERIPNSGVSAARNIGLRIAGGELIQFLDADDLLHPQKLERMAPLAANEPQSMVFCTAAVTELRSGRRLGSWVAPLEAGTDPVVYVFSTLIQTSTPLHRREHLVRVGGFREELRVWEDPDLHFRLAASGLSFKQVPQELVTLRRTDSSLSKRDPRHSLSMAKRFAIDAVELLKCQGELSNERAEAIAGFLASSARSAIRLGRGELADDFFEQARRVHPSGGIDRAYCGKTRWMRRLMGPVLTERLVGLKRSVWRQHAVG